VSKLHRLLRPDGLLILATQNRPALERNRVPPARTRTATRLGGPPRTRIASRIQVRRAGDAVDHSTFNRGVLRVVNSYRIHHTLRTVGLSGLTRRVKEYQKQLWLGWTIVVAARPTPLVGVGTSQVSSWSLGRSAWGDRAGTLSADHGIYGRALRGNCIDPRAHAGTNRPDDSSTATYG
jgi:hypothetical protein